MLHYIISLETPECLQDHILVSCVVCDTFMVKTQWLAVQIYVHYNAFIVKSSKDWFLSYMCISVSSSVAETS